MAAIRQLSEFVYQSGGNPATAYTFTIQVDGSGNVFVREVKSPFGLIMDTYTTVPKSVAQDITTAMADVETILATTSAVNGTAEFTADTSVQIVFGTALGSANYRVQLSVEDPILAWVSDKLTTGFTINVTTTYTGNVGWDVFV